MHKPSFMTPRKMDPDTCSSGPEFSSPEVNSHADAEDTPEKSTTETALVKYVDPESPTTGELDTGDTAKSATDNNRQPIFGGLNGGLPSPSRGEPRRGKFADVTGRSKVRKRRRQDHHSRDVRVGYHRSSYQTESSDDDHTVVNHHGARGGYEYSQPQPPQTPHSQQPSQSLIPSIFAWLESHPHLPHVLSFYAQLLLNFFLVFFVIYVIYSFWSTVRSDVDKQSEVVAAETLAEMAACAQQFVANRCEREHRVPAMESVCDNWERCMNKDPNAVGRARVSAHTFAEIFNSFVEPISYKAMVSILRFLLSPLFREEVGG